MSSRYRWKEKKPDREKNRKARERREKRGSLCSLKCLTLCLRRPFNGRDLHRFFKPLVAQAIRREVSQFRIIMCVLYSNINTALLHEDYVSILSCSFFFLLKEISGFRRVDSAVEHARRNRRQWLFLQLSYSGVCRQRC